MCSYIQRFYFVQVILDNVGKARLYFHFRRTISYPSSAIFWQSFDSPKIAEEGMKSFYESGLLMPEKNRKRKPSKTSSKYITIIEQKIHPSSPGTQRASFFSRNWQFWLTLHKIHCVQNRKNLILGRFGHKIASVSKLRYIPYMRSFSKFHYHFVLYWYAIID